MKKIKTNFNNYTKCKEVQKIQNYTTIFRTKKPVIQKVNVLIFYINIIPNKKINNK